MPAIVTATPYRDLYLADCRARDLSPRTVEKYGEAIDSFLATPGLPADVRDISAIDATRWLESLRARGQKPGTRSTWQRACWTWLRWLHRRGAIPVDIPAQVGAVRVRDADVKRRTCSDRDFERLLVCCERAEHRYRNVAILQVMLSTGVRREELCGLRWADWDQVARAVRVTGKGGKVRVIGIGVVATKALHEYRIEERGDAPGPMFYGRSKAPLTANAVRLLLASLSRGAGVTVAAHDLRRACAARMLEAGTSADDVMYHLGHETLRMTLLYGREGRQRRGIRAFHEFDSGLRRSG